ncbi:MAG TPA: AAA family ATPase [Chitinophagaceae bacterium]|nr:AAA family ATPase [Chitinophagaceae bacterium]
MDIRQIHEEVYRLLMKKNEQDSSFNFTFRRSNRGGKLEQGFWFYGTEHYLAVSFWSGMDWKNRTPNIYFTIINDGRTYLEIAVSDSDIKRDFIERFFLNASTSTLGLSPSGRRYVKEYSSFGNDYISSLNSFLKMDKKDIDDIIKHNQHFFEKPEDKISFISDEDFEETKKKVEKYRTAFQDQPEIIFHQTLIGFQIKDFGPIKDTGFIRISNDIQWIFLVGENGTGKTSLLKAIASGLCHTKIETGENTYIRLELFDSSSGIKKYERYGDSDVRKRKPLVSGFCCYGATRLKTSINYRSKFSFAKALNKNGLTSSLFDIDTVLIDIQEQLNFWKRTPNLLSTVSKRKEFIRELLVDLLPKVYNIRYSETENWEETLYVEKDDDGKELPPVSFSQLASGLKSLIAMIGDMMMRLFNQQPKIADPSELSGIVLIDEIDIHLHPKLQKYLVEQLTRTFPKVQFIATTHSPMPLLGAPLNSSFFKIERNVKRGVELTDLTEIRIDKLLPNAILTSDLFSMNELFSRDYPADYIRTEDSIKEIQYSDAIKSELKQIAERLRGEQ